jgi:hypothetical protein
MKATLGLPLILVLVGMPLAETYTGKTALSTLSLVRIIRLIIRWRLTNLSGNGGNGGDASSGDAIAYGKGAKAYSGPGGNASGGSVGDRKPGYGHKSGGVVNVASGMGSEQAAGTLDSLTIALQGTAEMAETLVAEKPLRIRIRITKLEATYSRCATYLLA